MAAHLFTIEVHASPIEVFPPTMEAPSSTMEQRYKTDAILKANLATIMPVPH